MYPGFVTCIDAIQKILTFPFKTLLQLFCAGQKRKAVSAPSVRSEMQMFVNDCVHRSHREIRLLCNFTTGHASIIQDQAFHALDVHRNDCWGLGTTTTGIVNDGRTAIFETFTPIRCFTAAERLITVLCLKYFVDICGFYVFVHRNFINTRCSMHALPLSSAILINL